VLTAHGDEGRWPESKSTPAVRAGRRRRRASRGQRHFCAGGEQGTGTQGPRLPLYRGAGAGALGAHAQADGPAAARPWRDCAGPRWALAGSRPGGPERVGPSGSARSSRIGFFPFFLNLFLMPETIPKNLDCFKGTKNT
jgi:hypothetical protein